MPLFTGLQETILEFIQSRSFERCMFRLFFHRRKGQTLTLWQKFFQGRPSLPCCIFEYTLVLVCNRQLMSCMIPRLTVSTVV